MTAISSRFPIFDDHIFTNESSKEKLAISFPFPSLSAGDLSAIGEKIFKNETSGDKSKLLWWHPKEQFPSLGIGHFVWLPLGCSVGFLADIFSAFLDFCMKKGVTLPSWLQRHQKCPWNKREDFLNAESAGQLNEVRDFLNLRIDIQTEFIIENFLKSLPAVIFALSDQKSALTYCHLLLDTPGGCFALVDYNHFKGQGIGEYPEYNYQGWGLKQVLERALGKNWVEQPLNVFIESAKETLANRVKNAPGARKLNEESFIPGWYNRLDGYKIC